MVPAIPKETYLQPIRDQRKIKHKPFTEYVSHNMVEKYVRKNSKPYRVPEAKNSQQYKHSFFVRTIPEWNILDNEIISAGSVESFKAQLAMHATYLYPSM